jgi:putative ABC transport system permease protein
MGSDLRYAFRQLRKSPAFATTALLTLGLGIGAATAIFSIVDAVVLRPLPYPAADRLVRIYSTTPSDTRLTFSGPDFLDLEANQRVFTAIAASRRGSASLTRPGGAIPLESMLVTTDYFHVFGVSAMVGRTFRRDEVKSTGRAAVLSHDAWQRHFSGRSGVVGETIEIDRYAHQVVGVMPPKFGSPFAPDLWLVAPGDVPDAPFQGDEDYEHNRDVHYLEVVARLGPGVSREAADTAVRTIASRLEQAYPDTNRGRSARVVGLHEDVVGDVRPALVMLLAAVAIVLAVVAVNIASLLIARGAARQREMSIRAAVGAPRRRLVYQLLAESLVLGIAGGVAGFTVALWTLELLVAIGPGNVPRLSDATIDLRVFAFSALLSVTVAVGFGLVPAVQASRTDIVSVFRQAIGGGRARQRLRSVLVGVELAASVVLLVIAGLVARSFLELQRVELGYDVSNVYSMGLPLPEGGRYATEEQQALFFQRLLPEVRSLSGVESAAAVFPRPLSGGAASGDFQIVGRPASSDSDRPVVGISWITPEYFKVMRIPLLNGRVFDDRDRAGSQPVIVINQRAAERNFPSESPIGQRIRFSSDEDDPPLEIVGVVANTRGYGIGRAPEPEIYLPHAQTSIPFMSLVVRAKGDPSAVAAALRSRIAALDPSLPAGDLTPLEEAIHEQLAPSRFRSILLVAFGAATLLLAGIGIYGLISYSVAQRASEIGIRLALGASRAQVRRLVMGNGMALALAGLGAGLVLAFLASRWMSSLLFEVRPADPLTMVGVVALLLSVALAACYLPARRAMGIDPATALRSE